MAAVPGQPKQDDMPLLEHLVEKVADGATCMHQEASNKNPWWPLSRRWFSQGSCGIIG